MACLPGRSIHHSLLLMSELLYFAGESEIPHILMKLDITKAFDKLEWSVLLPLLEHLGFGHKNKWPLN
jgi:hypothetical protein